MSTGASRPSPCGGSKRRGAQSPGGSSSGAAAKKGKASSSSQQLQQERRRQSPFEDEGGCDNDDHSAPGTCPICGAAMKGDWEKENQSVKTRERENVRLFYDGLR